MWFVATAFVSLALALGAPESPRPQETPAPSMQPQKDFFTGTVTELSDTKITVNRTVLGKNSEDRTFAITPGTRVEGKLRLKAKVTVKFAQSDEGEKAVHIIVRSSQKK